MMSKGDSKPENTESALIAVVSLPIALYESNGLLFELYDGGQPYRSFTIHWETIKPIRISEQPDSDSQRSMRSSEPA